MQMHRTGFRQGLEGSLSRAPHLQGPAQKELLCDTAVFCHLHFISCKISPFLLSPDANIMIVKWLYQIQNLFTCSRAHDYTLQLCKMQLLLGLCPRLHWLGSLQRFPRSPSRIMWGFAPPFDACSIS